MTAQKDSPFDVVIDLANATDRADVLRLLAQQLADHDIDIDRDKLGSAMDGLLDDSRRGRILVARHDARCIGVAVLAYTWTLEHGGQSCWLDELYVEPALRGQGIGSQMLQAAYDRAAMDGCVAMDLEVEASHARVVALYLREGFQAHTRSRFVRALRMH